MLLWSKRLDSIVSYYILLRSLDVNMLVWSHVRLDIYTCHISWHIMIIAAPLISGAQHWSLNIERRGEGVSEMEHCCASMRDVTHTKETTIEDRHVQVEKTLK